MISFFVSRVLQTQWKWKESESRSVRSTSLPPHGLYSLWNSPGQNTGVGSLSLLQGIFPTQGSSPGLPHCRRILYLLSHKGSPSKQPQIKCLHLSNTTIVATVSNQFIHIYTVGSSNKIIQNLKEEQYLKLHLFVSLKVRDLAFSVLVFISHVGICRRPVSYDTEDHGKAMGPQGKELCQQGEWTWRLIISQLSLLSDTFIATLWRP